MLGEGAFARVLAATLPDGREVAVKVLAPDAASRADAAWVFASEPQRLERFAHPGLPRVHEQGRTTDGRPYYVMDLARGETPRGPWSAARVRGVMAGAAAVLAHMHARGYVHGDLKPENMRVDGDHVWLLDLGLMVPRGTRREAVAGSPAYLAPEGFRTTPAEPGLDLYALGVAAFELWTGHTPFGREAGSAVEQLAVVIRGHLAERPRLPAAQQEADPALAALVLALLGKAPGDRPASAGAVLAALGRPAPAEATLRGLSVGAFVGRAAVLDAWSAGTADIRLAGGSGSGKTRALEELGLLARQAGWRWAAAACTGEGDAPMGPLRAVVTQALAAAGHTAEPALAAWLAGEEPAAWRELEPAARRGALTGAIAGALAAAAAQVPGLAIALDDWHLADPATRALVESLPSSGPQGCRWLLAGDETSWPADRALPLAPLADDDVALWLAARLAAAPPAGLAAHLGHLAAGAPLALDLLLEQMVSEGALHADEAGWRWQPDEGSSREAGAGLAALWRARLAALPAAARAVARAAAVAAPAGGCPAWLLPRLVGPPGAIAGAPPDAAAGSSDAMATAGLEALCAAGLFVVHEGRARPTAPGLAATLVEELSPEERRHHAAAVANALLSAWPDAAAGEALSRLPTDTLVAAATMALAGQLAAAPALALEAARRCHGMGSPQRAVGFFDAAEPLCPAAQRPRLHFERAEALRWLDQRDRARADYELAVAASPADWRPAFGLAKVLQLGGDYAAALTSFDAALAAARAANAHDGLAKTEVARARVLVFQGEQDAARAACVRAEDLARAHGHAALLAQALVLRAVLEVQHDPREAPRALAMLAEARDLARALGDRHGLAQAWDNVGNTHMALGDLPAALAAFQAFAAGCAEVGAHNERISGLLNQARVAAELGHADALALAEAAVAGAAAAGRKLPEALAHAVAGQALARRGHPAEAARRLDAALALVVDPPIPYAEAHVRRYRLEAALERGDAAGASVEAAALGPLAERAALAPYHVLARAAIAHLDGDPATATTLAAPLADALDRVVAHQAHALLADAAADRGQRADALRHAHAALAIAHGWDSAWHGVRDARRLARLYGHAEAAPAGTAGALDPGAFDAWVEHLVAAEDEPGLAATALQAAMDLARAERGYLLAYEDGRLRQAVALGLDYAAEVEGGYSRSIAEAAMFGASPIYSQDARTDERWEGAASVMALDLRTVIALPLASGLDVLGVLYMDRRDALPLLAPADMSLLMTLARTTAGLMARERARRAAADAEARQRACLALATSLAATSPAEHVRAALLAQALAAAGAQRAFWLAHGPTGWQALAERGGSFATAGLSTGMLDWVRRRREPLAVMDASNAEDFAARGSVQALGLRTVWCLPIDPAGNELLYLDAPGLDDPPAAAVTTLAALAAVAWPLTFG